MQDSLTCKYLRSTLGLKLLMAVTGVILFGFLIGHLAGNLLVFLGPAKFNAYAKFLHDNPGLVWGTRLLLLLSVGIHIVASIRLTKLKSDARPVPYLGKRPHGSSYASRTMMWSGPIVALFVIYHLLHFTTGQAHPSFDPDNVYLNVVTGFQRPVVCATYILAMLALGLHLAHGLWSALQTVGINRPHLEPLLRKAAAAVAALLIAGFIAVPLGVLFRIVEAR
jgi:succinate dehydrogenase / fumarate reductase, cytochrome b subunit